MNKKALHWNYLVATFLVLFIVLTLLLFYGFVKGTIISKGKEFLTMLSGLLGR